MAAAASLGAEVEVRLERTASAVTRFADSRIHQNTLRVDGEVRVRAVLDGGRSGVAVTNSMAEDDVTAAVRQAVEAARTSPADPAFGGLAEPATYAGGSTDDPATAAAAPGERADLVAVLLAQLPTGVAGAGALETGRTESAVVNSLGVRAYAGGTRAVASILASGPDSTGYAEDTSHAVSALPVAELGRRAADKVHRGRFPSEVPPGSYPVVLEAAAVTTLVQWLGYATFAGKGYTEGRSAFSGRLGERVCSPLVTIVDDPLSPVLPGVPFDAEGTPTRRTTFLHAGIAAAVAHDRTSGKAAGVSSTGHALPAPNSYGGLPLHLVMEPGDATDEELVAGVERGLYVTRFHYTNLVHPVATRLTGMTRDGTFLIEGGVVVGGVRNLRFTESILGALDGVEAVSRSTGASGDLFFGPARTPSLRLASFGFTSGAAH